MIERGVERFFVVCGEMLVKDAAQFHFPVTVLDPAARFGDAAGEPDQLFCDTSEAATALEARSFHCELLLLCSVAPAPEGRAHQAVF